MTEHPHKTPPNETIPDDPGGTLEPVVAEDQQAYAKIIAPGVLIILAVLVLTFAIYMVEATEPHIPADEVQQYWSMPSEEYIQAVDAPRGWGWLWHLPKSDYLNDVGICLLATLTAVAYLRLLPIYLRQRAWLLIGFVVAELVVIGVAMSGLIRVGH